MGFTLIELVVVLTVIAILAAISVPNFLEAQVRSKVSRVNQDMSFVAVAMETYRLDNGHYPIQTVSLSDAGLRNVMDQAKAGYFPGDNLMIWDSIQAEMSKELGVSETPTPTPAPTPAPVQFDFEMMLMMGDPFAQQQPPMPQNAPLSLNERATSRVLTRMGFIYMPTDPGSLFALTSPVHYISQERFRDPFGDQRGYQWGRVIDIDSRYYKYVNLNQVNAEGVSIPGLGQNLPYILFSNSPETETKVFPFPPVSPYIPYDPTNGTVSKGTIYFAP
jgi:prepilin-type N-terminal cleavage/methylation domain-containing protein